MKIETMHDKASRRFHNGMMSHSNGILKFLEGLRRETEGKERDLIPWDQHFIVSCVFVVVYSIWSLIDVCIVAFMLTNMNPNWIELRESCSKFNFKQCSFKNSDIIVRAHGNMFPWQQNIMGNNVYIPNITPLVSFVFPHCLPPLSRV